MLINCEQDWKRDSVAVVKMIRVCVCVCVGVFTVFTVTVYCWSLSRQCVCVCVCVLQIMQDGENKEGKNVPYLKEKLCLALNKNKNNIRLFIYC